IAFAAAIGGIQWFVYRENNVCNSNIARQLGQRVSPAWPTNTIDQFMPTQFTEELFKIGKRDILPLADRGQRNWSALLAQGQIDHGCDGEAPFGCQPHDGSFV